MSPLGNVIHASTTVLAIVEEGTDIRIPYTSISQKVLGDQAVAAFGVTYATRRRCYEIAADIAENSPGHSVVIVRYVGKEGLRDA